MKTFGKNWWILPLTLIFLTGLFLRIYRLNDLLGFYYDQARDALVIHQIIHEGKLTLIGPTTGIEGIFLGPFYYYLLTPGYFFGQGNPAVAAALVSFVNSLTIIVIFVIGKRLFNSLTGIIGAFLFAFSWSNIYLARWFANPSPLPFFASLVILSLVKLKEGGKPFWVIILAINLAFSLQIEAAGAIWFIPAISLSLLLFKIRVSKKWLAGSLVVFFALSSAQLIFDLKHNFLITKAFYRFLIEERSFKTSLIDTLLLRIPFYLQTYANALKFDFTKTTLLFLGSLASILFLAKNTTRNLKGNFWKFGVLLVWIISPLVGLIFYQGNNGYVWEYYLLGTFPAFYLLLGFAISLFFTKKFLIPLAIFLLYFYLNQNLNTTLGYLLQSYPGENTINFTNQKQAIDLIYKDTKGEDFNADAYVPPVIPYTYDYLFLWYGQKKYGYLPKKEILPILYTIEEADPPHPERLKAFIDRQDSFAKVVSSQKIGGITVEKRIRFKNSD